MHKRVTHCLFLLLVALLSTGQAGKCGDTEYLVYYVHPITYPYTGPVNGPELQVELRRPDDLLVPCAPCTTTFTSVVVVHNRTKQLIVVEVQCSLWFLGETIASEKVTAVEVHAAESVPVAVTAAMVVDTDADVVAATACAATFDSTTITTPTKTFSITTSF